MSNYTQQQEAVILKGIASQILSMNMPKLEIVKKLFLEMGIEMDSHDMYATMYTALQVAVELSDEIKTFIKKENKLQFNSDLAHHIAHFAMKDEFKLDKRKLANAVTA